MAESSIERMTITMPAELAKAIKEIVADGDYASTSEVIREALREWKTKRLRQADDLARLKFDIDRGLADLAAGRVSDYDKNEIVERGRRLLGKGSAFE